MNCVHVDGPTAHVPCVLMITRMAKCRCCRMSLVEAHRVLIVLVQVESLRIYYRRVENHMSAMLKYMSCLFALGRNHFWSYIDGCRSQAACLLAAVGPALVLVMRADREVVVGS